MQQGLVERVDNKTRKRLYGLVVVINFKRNASNFAEPVQDFVLLHDVHKKWMSRNNLINIERVPLAFD